MEGTNRWETEALRESRERRRGRPAVSQDRSAARRTGEWVTLREASDATGIPIGTLRKWCRRESVDSYLESDGEVTLRIVELDAVRRRANALGRETQDTRHKTQDDVPPTEGWGDAEEAAGSDAGGTVQGTASAPPDKEARPDTMIVPVDAWNKMLNQLGNLHEAGQQLAEARERAAKAETEAAFLRERLNELRNTHVPPHSGGTRSEATQGGSGGSDRDDEARSEADNREPTTSTEEVPDTDYRIPTAAGEARTVSFWRYVVRGWKRRRR